MYLVAIEPWRQSDHTGAYWLTYPEIVKLCDGVPVYLYTKDSGYKVTAKQIEDAITDKTKAVILNTPNNPTGMVYSEGELRAIADVAVKNDIYVVADEMYENLIYGDKKHVSIASLGEEIYKRTITCSGLSKSYSMTGWRIGYTGSSAEIAKLMGSIQSHQTSNPNSIAQKAALEALQGPQDAVAAMREEFDQRRKYMYERVSQMPLVDALEPEGAFYTFVDFTDVLEKSYKGVRIGTASRVAEILIEDYKVRLFPARFLDLTFHKGWFMLFPWKTLKRPGSHRGIRLFFVRAENSLCKRQRGKSRI